MSTRRIVAAVSVASSDRGRELGPSDKPARKKKRASSALRSGGPAAAHGCLACRSVAFGYKARVPRSRPRAPALPLVVEGLSLCVVRYVSRACSVQWRSPRGVYVVYHRVGALIVEVQETGFGRVGFADLGESYFSSRRSSTELTPSL